MFDEDTSPPPLRERFAHGTEDKLGKAIADLLENPLVTGAIGKAFDARERAVAVQELTLSALNIPTAADVERLTRRLRSVSQRLEGIEDGVHRISRSLADTSGVERRLDAVEEQLKSISEKLSRPARSPRKAGASRQAAGTSKTRKSS